MQYCYFLKDLNQNIPNRAPGSNELNRVIETIKKTTPDCGLKPQITLIPVYSIQTSINFFIIGSLLFTFLGLASPVLGFIGQAALFALLGWELRRPIFSKIKTEQSSNLVYTIPARSKESQKIILTASLTTDQLIDPPTELSFKTYMTVLYILAILPVLFQFCVLLTGERRIDFLSIIPLAFLTFLPFVKRSNNINQTLNNCEALLELGSILAKAQPAITSVTIILTGARSLNSGLQSIDDYLKGVELGYVINLIDLPEKRINISVGEGAFFPRPSDPVLTELLLDVSREKNIPIQTAKLKEISESYLLKLKKVKAITVTNPLLIDSNKNLRELLVGFIRKIDRPS